MTRPLASPPGRRSRRRWRTWALASALTATIAVVTVASAAQLNVFARDRSIDHALPCTSATLSTTATGTPSAGSYTQIQISGIPSSCNDLDVSLVVYGVGGTELATGTGTTGTSGTAAIAASSFVGSDVQGVALLVDTWGIRTTWTPPNVVPTIECVVINPGGRPTNEGCTATPANLSVYGGNDYAYFQINVSYDGGSWPNNRGWRATIHFDDPWFPWQPVYVKRTAGASVLYGSCGTEPYSTVTVQTPSNAGAGNKWGSVFFIAHWNDPPVGTDPAGVVICP